MFDVYKELVTPLEAAWPRFLTLKSSKTHPYSYTDKIAAIIPCLVNIEALSCVPFGLNWDCIKLAGSLPELRRLSFGVGELFRFAARRVVFTKLEFLSLRTSLDQCEPFLSIIHCPMLNHLRVDVALDRKFEDARGILTFVGQKWSDDSLLPTVYSTPPNLSTPNLFIHLPLIRFTCAGTLNR